MLIFNYSIFIIYNLEIDEANKLFTAEDINSICIRKNSYTQQEQLNPNNSNITKLQNFNPTLEFSINIEKDTFKRIYAIGADYLRFYT